jgi:hypothetical protein
VSHPASCTDPDCTLTYREHLVTIAVSPAALPSRSVTRNPDTHDEPTEVTRHREKTWLEQDMPAYKRLRDAGYSPAGTKGAAQRERELGG